MNSINACQHLNIHSLEGHKLASCSYTYSMTFIIGPQCAYCDFQVACLNQNTHVNKITNQSCHINAAAI